MKSCGIFASDDPEVSATRAALTQIALVEPMDAAGLNNQPELRSGERRMAPRQLPTVIRKRNSSTSCLQLSRTIRTLEGFSGQRKKTTGISMIARLASTNASPDANRGPPRFIMVAGCSFVGTKIVRSEVQNFW